MGQTWTAETWPIAAAMIPFPGVLPDGSSVHDAGPEAWAEDLRQIAWAGFDAVDPTDSWVRVADLEPKAREEFLAVCNDLGLSIPAISTARRNLIDPERGADYLAYAHRVIDTAAEIGAHSACFGFFGPLTEAQKAVTWFWTEKGLTNPDDPAIYELAVERVRELARHGEEVGVQVALEMYEDTYIGTARGAVKFITEVDHPNAKLNLDIGNLIRLHRPVEPWAEMIALCAPYAGYWHMKNYMRLEDSQTGQILTHPAPLVGGTINYRAAISAVLEYGYDAPFLLEHYGGDGLYVCAENRAYLRQVLRATLHE